MTGLTALPDVNAIGLDAPWRWLGGGWRDLWRCPFPCLAYGLLISVVIALMLWAVLATSGAMWVLALTCGLVFIAPMLCMGLYEAGRIIEQGRHEELLAKGGLYAALYQMQFQQGPGEAAGERK